MKIKPILLMICLLVSVSDPATNFANEPTAEGRDYQVEFRDGTIVTRKFAKTTLLWSNVSSAGELSKKPIQFARIKSLKLASEPASAQLAEVLRLIAQLDSDNFYAREIAETELIASGARFRAVIEQNTNMKTADGTYRLQRVLNSMKSSKDKRGFELDMLTLVDGTKLSGDAGNDDFVLVAGDGKSRSVARDLIASISPANQPLKTRIRKSEFVRTKLYHNHAKFMKDRGLRLVDFQHRPNDEQLRSIDKDVTKAFVDWGMVLGTEFPEGAVGISGYTIRGGDRPVGGNSVCVYQSKDRTVKRFQGVMEITFCKPGQQNVPHGVHDVGMFISRVEHSRDVLVEAWDAAGRLIGVCSSSDEPCTFCGISSSVPIAKVRVLSNPWMLELRKLNAPPERSFRQKVDLDYAVDTIMFSPPKPVDSLKPERHYLGKNGDVINASEIRVFGKNRIEVDAENIPTTIIGFSDANTIALQPAETAVTDAPYQQKWLAMLRDNSVLQWSEGSPLRSQTLGQDIDPDLLVAVWPANKRPHLPLGDDFENGKNVLVYPGCRVATGEVVMDQAGFRWDSQNVLTEDLHREDEQKVDPRSNDVPDAVAPRMKSYGWDISELPAYEIPTIWFAQPQSMLADQGSIKLEGGEVLVFGKDALFQLVSMDQQNVTLKFAEQTITVPLSKVTKIVVPQE